MQRRCNADDILLAKRLHQRSFSSQAIDCQDACLLLLLLEVFYYISTELLYLTYMFIYNSNRLKWSTNKKFTQHKLTYKPPSEHYTLSKLHDQFKSACLLACLMASLRASTLASHLRSRHLSSSVSAVGVLAYL